MVATHNTMINGNRLKLGFFSANCSGGMAITNVPERWGASWEDNLALARLCDTAGIEFLLPVARWIGYGGGSSGFHDDVLETITWCAGLLAATERLTVFATTHTAFFHPIVAARQFATIDHISNGRFGLNVVCGWNKMEYDMFGIDLPEAHDARYAMGQEWFDIVQKIWTSETPFDWDGEHYRLRHVLGSPRPRYGRPPVMNAGSSPQGRDFALRNADYLFTVLTDLDNAADEVATIQALASEQTQFRGVFTTAHVVCRPSRAEAEDYYAHYAGEMADWDRVDALMRLQGMHSQSWPEAHYRQFRERFAGGLGTWPIVGSPDDVADTLARISGAGYHGVAMGLVNYTEEFPFFRDEVLPRLVARGLREA